jgi:hypothetical protein
MKAAIVVLSRRWRMAYLFHYTDPSAPAPKIALRLDLPARLEATPPARPLFSFRMKFYVIERCALFAIGIALDPQFIARMQHDAVNYSPC